MKVSTNRILSLNPCGERLQNFLYHYGHEWHGTMTSFLSLEHLTHSDKLWVYFRLIPREVVPHVAADFVERVVHIYEEAFPDDLRPRRAIQAARSGDRKAAYAASAAISATYTTSVASVEEAAQIAIMKRWMRQPKRMAAIVKKGIK